MKNGKKLLQINTVVNSGSTGRITEELGQIVLANGWESYIAFGRRERLSKSVLIKVGTTKDIILHGIKTRLFDKHGLGSYNATEKLIRQINRIKPDIIHIHNIHGYYLNIEVLFNYLSQKNIPVVWTFHDCWAMTGHCTFFDYIGCTKWKTECFNCAQINQYPSSLYIDNSKSNFLLKRKLFNSIKNLTIITVSNWLENIVKQSFLSHQKVKTIHNGININIFSPNSINKFRNKFKIENKFIILGVANVWGSRKGLKDFIKLSALLENDFIIVLVGLRSSQIKILPENIIGLNRTENQQELAELYSTANVFLNLSVEETFGLTTVEALACGTPAIVYNSTASPELITVGSGFVVEKGDFPKLIKAIQIVKKNGKSAYSKICIERAKYFYNKDDRYLEYLRLYESLLDSPKI